MIHHLYNMTSTVMLPNIRKGLVNINFMIPCFSFLTIQFEIFFHAGIHKKKTLQVVLEMKGRSTNLQKGSLFFYKFTAWSMLVCLTLKTNWAKRVRGRGMEFRLSRPPPLKSAADTLREPKWIKMDLIIIRFSFLNPEC